jgi:hypothetical protein
MFQTTNQFWYDAPNNDQMISCMYADFGSSKSVLRRAKFRSLADKTPDFAWYVLT